MSTVLLVYDPPYLSIQKPILFALRIQYTIFLLEVELSPPWNCPEYHFFPGFIAI